MKISTLIFALLKFWWRYGNLPVVAISSDEEGSYLSYNSDIAVAKVLMKDSQDLAVMIINMDEFEQPDDPSKRHLRTVQ